MRWHHWLWLSLLVLALPGLIPSPAQAQSHVVDIDRYYHYPHHYFPQSYWPNMVKWPDPYKQMQPPPAYMAYPPYLDPSFHYPLWRPMRYYKGFHFWLDQF